MDFIAPALSCSSLGSYTSQIRYYTQCVQGKSPKLGHQKGLNWGHCCRRGLWDYNGAHRPAVNASARNFNPEVTIQAARKFWTPIIKQIVEGWENDLGKGSGNGKRRARDFPPSGLGKAQSALE